jgi:hypothetical protein
MGTDVWNQQVAQSYDASSAHMYAPEVLGPTVDFLARRAGRGPVLELAIGTGRVALPLAARGVPVAGIDTFDLVNHGLVSHHYWIKDGTARTFQSPHRSVWPSELDLMARLAGLDLRERWADWNQTPVTAASTANVSVWRKPHGEGRRSASR